MNKKQQKREKVALVVAMIGGVFTLVSLVLLFIVVLSYNEELLSFAYGLAYLVVLIGLITFGLLAFAIGMERAQQDGGLELLRHRTGQLAMGIIVAAFLVILLSRIQVQRHEVETVVRNSDGSLKVDNK